jgi:CheY-like chemotaxis protein
METKILLINNNLQENGIIQEALNKAIGSVSLLKAENGKSAFNILMGGHQAKPSVILLNHDLLDMSAIDFLRVMQNYYTLNHIKIFLITEPLSDTLRESFFNLGVTNFIYRPLLSDSNIFATIKSSFHVSPAFIGLFSVEQLKAQCVAGFSKVKFILSGQSPATQGIYGVGTKLMVLACTLLLITGAAHSLKKRGANNRTVNATENVAPPVMLMEEEKAEMEPISNIKPLSVKHPLEKQHTAVDLNNSINVVDSLPVAKLPRQLHIKVIEETDSIPY